MRRGLIDPKHASLDQRPGDPAHGTALLDLPLNRLRQGFGGQESGSHESLSSAGSLSSAEGGSSESLSRGFRLQAEETGKEHGDTTSIQVADAAGNLFSATPSSGWLLGGAFVAGATGVP